MCGTASFARARAPVLHRHTAPMCGKTRLRRTVFSLAQVLGMWRGHYTRARHVRSDTNAVQAYFTGANTTGSCGTRTPQAMPHTCCRPTRKRNTKRMSAGNPRGGFPFLRASHFLWHPVGGARPRSAAIIHEERHAAEPPSHPSGCPLTRRRQLKGARRIPPVDKELDGDGGKLNPTKLEAGRLAEIETKHVNAPSLTQTHRHTNKPRKS